jgi:hypothetical protein
MGDKRLSISPLYKGNTPLMHFSFVNDSGTVIVLPNDVAKIRVWIHDSANVRQGAGILSNLVASAGTVDYLASSADTANAGVATFWTDALLGSETVPRTFDPQKVLIQDVTQV